MRKILILISILFVSLSAYAQIYSAIPEPSAARDAFGRWRVSNPETIFDAQFTYNLQPLVFDTITVGANTSINYDAVNHLADMKFASSPTGSTVAMQSFEYLRYQPGKSQQVFVTFNMWGGQSNIVKFAGYSDGDNGIEFIMNGTTPSFRILSETGEGDETVAQSSWNLDKLNGSGLSGDSLDFTKVQILVIDFQALYVGRVRVGFDIDGELVYAHEFDHANVDSYPYMATANLPLRVGMTSSATVSDSIYFICSSVISEGGQELVSGYPFSVNATVTAGNGTDTHILAIQPKTTFAGETNRVKFRLESIDIAVTGANPVIWKLCVGQAYTSTSSADVNATYSAMETYSGTLSGSPGLVMETGIVPATSQSKAAEFKQTTLRIPITLDHEGLQRDMGRLTLLVQGIGGTSVTYASFNWVEIR